MQYDAFVTYCSEEGNRFRAGRRPEQIDSGLEFGTTGLCRRTNVWRGLRALRRQSGVATTLATLLEPH
jgi:hypothetical protein